MNWFNWTDNMKIGVYAYDKLCIDFGQMVLNLPVETESNNLNPILIRLIMLLYSESETDDSNK